jgi:hypothetical protein
MVDGCESGGEGDKGLGMRDEQARGGRNSGSQQRIGRAMSGIGSGCRETVTALLRVMRWKDQSTDRCSS